MLVSRDVFRTLTNINDVVFCENMQNAPSQMFDRVLNTPLYSTESALMPSFVCMGFDQISKNPKYPTLILSNILRLGRATNLQSCVRLTNRCLRINNQKASRE